MSFGISSQTLAEQQQLIDSVRAQVGTPPAGVEVRLAGLPVIAAEAALRTLLEPLLAGARRARRRRPRPARSCCARFRRALVPLLPTVLATGWASLLIWLTGIPLNPMSAALGALTIAIATEFAVILSGRFEQERSVGLDAAAALRRAYARTGAAVLASGLTAIAGFAVLIASDIQMLRDFGAVTVIDLAAALLGVIVILPATLVLLERRRAPWGGGGAGMRDRYSIAVGLIFLALIAVATIHTLTGGGGEDTLGLDKQPARWPLPEFAVPAASGAPRRRRQHLPGRLRQRLAALPGRPAARPRLPDHHPRRDPRLRPLRPPAGDLVLVRHRKPLRAPAKCGQRGRGAVPWTGELPFAGRSRFAWIGSGTGPRTRLADAGRLRPRRRRRGALPGRPLPDLRLRLSRAAPCRAPASANLASAALSHHVRELLNATRVAERG